MVSLEGSDPARTKKLLEMLLFEFKKQATRENDDKLEDPRITPTELEDSRGAREARQGDIEIPQENTTIGPGGRNILEERVRKSGHDDDAEADATRRTSAADEDGPDVSK